MVWVFPSLDVVWQAVQQGHVPAALARAPVEALLTLTGACRIALSKPVSRTVAAAWQQLGANVTADKHLAGGRTYCCWAELFPLVVERELEPVPADRPVLFEATSEAASQALVSELLRLGCTRLRGKTDRPADTPDGPSRYLIEAIGPPYYTLLRVTTPADPGARELRAYLESAPGIWVHWGWRHPLVEQLRTTANTGWLLAPESQWKPIARTGWHDLIPLLTYDLEAVPEQLPVITDWQNWRIPLQCLPAETDAPPGLWVLDEAGSAGFAEWLGTASPSDTQRLSFAIVRQPTGQQIVLRLRPGQGRPPAISLSGTAYYGHALCAGLHLPCGQRLRPHLPRAVLEAVLQLHPERITWLDVSPTGGVKPVSVEFTAFRPLAEWVDYVIDQQAVALRTWEAAFRFEATEFVIVESPAASMLPASQPEEAAFPPPFEAESQGEPTLTGEPHAALQLAPLTVANELVSPSAEPLQPGTITPAKLSWKERLRQRFGIEVAEQRDAQPAPLPPAFHKRLQQLERRFLQEPAELDDSQRFATWRLLARMYAFAGNWSDAAACWRALFWLHDDAPKAWWKEWLHAEQQGHPGAPPPRRIDKWLGENSLRLSRARLVLLHALWAQRTGIQREFWRSKLSEWQHLLLAVEGHLPLRLAWWSWLAYAELSGGDTLALAQARERLLGRLHQLGYRAARELPSFLRQAPSQNTVVQSQSLSTLSVMQSHCLAWIERGSSGTRELTRALAAELLHYGAIRCGAGDIVFPPLSAPEASPADLLWVRGAWRWRSQEARQQLRGAPWPETLQQQLEALSETERYRVDRYRQLSRLLEPQAVVDPFRRWNIATVDDLRRELATLEETRDPSEFQHAVRYWRERVAVESPLRAARILSALLGQFGQFDAQTAEEILGTAVTVWEQLPDPLAALEFLERALLVAGHYDLPLALQRLLGRLEQLDQATLDPIQIAQLAQLLRQALPALNRAGQRTEFNDWLERLEQLVAERAVQTTPKNSPLMRLKGSQPGWEWMRVRLVLATAWFESGAADRAWPILEEVKAALLAAPTLDLPRAQVAVAWIETLGQAPREAALPQLLDLWDWLPPMREPLASNWPYSLGQLLILEAAIVALCESCELAARADTWSTKDEFLIRRRIHADVRAATQGMR